VLTVALTKQKRLYADARLAGLGKKESAVKAGCPVKTASQAASRLEKDPEIIAAMARATPRDWTLPVNPSVNSADSDNSPPRAASNAALSLSDPLAYLAGVMDDLNEDPKMRADAAKAMLPYMHGKIGEQGKKESQSQLAKETSKGRFAAGAPPLRSVK
jgi:phage terminase small subunit